MFNQWLTKVINTKVGNGQCGDLVYNWGEFLYPSVKPYGGLPSVADAKDFAGFNGNNYHWVANNHSDTSQLPVQGDILVFGPTPALGYTNTFNNPFGHTGVCDSANASGYTLAQQNAPESGEHVNVTTYPWKFRPCLGWLHPASVTSPPQQATPTPPHTQAQTITLPKTTGPWHLYKPGSAGNKNEVLGLLYPSKFDGLTYTILASLGNGVYRIHTQDFGIGDLFTKGSDVVIK